MHDLSIRKVLNKESFSVYFPDIKVTGERSMKKVSIISFCMIALMAFVMWAPDAVAFEFYSDATNDQGGCAQCHTGFRDNGSYVSQAEGVPWNRPRASPGMTVSTTST
jgi:hypothetical protein